MQTSNELVIHGHSDEIAALLKRVEESGTGGWRSDRDLEARMRYVTPGHFWFSCSDAPGRPAAGLCLSTRIPREWYVADLLPLSRPLVSDEEANQVLRAFEAEVLNPLFQGTAIFTEIRPVRIRLEDHVSVEAAWCLRAFSQQANKSAALADWQDRERWNAFLIQDHRHKGFLDLPTLEAWLASEGWSAEQRAPLLHEYVVGSGLLSAYDQELKELLG